MEIVLSGLRRSCATIRKDLLARVDDLLRFVIQPIERDASHFVHHDSTNHVGDAERQHSREHDCDERPTGRNDWKPAKERSEDERARREATSELDGGASQTECASEGEDDAKDRKRRCQARWTCERIRANSADSQSGNEKCRVGNRDRAP